MYPHEVGLAINSTLKLISAQFSAKTGNNPRANFLINLQNNRAKGRHGIYMSAL